MDIATILGIFSGLGLVFYAIFLGGNFGGFVDYPSLLIVFGGTIASTFIKFKLKRVFGAVSVVKHAFLVKEQDPSGVIKQIIDMANKARKDSLLALGNVKVQNDLMQKGIQLIVDGIAPDLVRNILNTEIAFMKSRHQMGQKIFTGMGESAPAFGMIGTLIGLVNMLQNMEDPSNIGPAMAVALLTTFYGAFFANLILLPIADKLSNRSAEEQLVMKLTVEGLLSIQAGDNPRVIEEKLLSFLSPDLRGNKKGK